MGSHPGMRHFSEDDLAFFSCTMVFKSQDLGSGCAYKLLEFPHSLPVQHPDLLDEHSTYTYVCVYVCVCMVRVYIKGVYIYIWCTHTKKHTFTLISVSFYIFYISTVLSLYRN